MKNFKPGECGVEITDQQRAALSSLLAISEKQRSMRASTARLSSIGFGGQGDGGSCTVGGGDSSSPSTDSTYVLDPLSDSTLPTGDTNGDVVVEVVTSTIVDWAPIDGYAATDSSGDYGFPSDSGTGDSGTGDTGTGDTGTGDTGTGDSGSGDGGGGDSWGPS